MATADSKPESLEKAQPGKVKSTGQRVTSLEQQKQNQNSAQEQNQNHNRRDPGEAWKDTKTGKQLRSRRGSNSLKHVLRNFCIVVAFAVIVAGIIKYCKGDQEFAWDNFVVTSRIVAGDLVGFAGFPRANQTKMRVVVVGGGYAGIAACRDLEAVGVDVTLVERNENFFHKIGGARASVQAGFEEDCVIPYVSLLERADSRVVRGEAIGIDTEASKVQIKRFDGKIIDIPYDALVLAMGMVHGYGQLPDRAMSRAEMVEYLRSEQVRVQNAKEVVVVGGGALGVETATQIRETFPDKTVHLYHSRGKLMSSTIPPISNEFVKVLEEKLLPFQIELHMNAGRLSEKELQERHPGALVISTVGCLPNKSSAQFVPKEWTNPKTGEILVEPTLRVKGGPFNVYAMGDIAATGDYKQARWAFQHAKVLAKNIKGGQEEYHPVTTNPWWAYPLSFIGFYFVRARVQSAAVIGLYLGSTDGLTQFFGILFNDRFAAKKLKKDKMVGHARHWLRLGSHM